MSGNYRKPVMTTFVHPTFSFQHIGAARAANAAQGLQAIIGAPLRRLSGRVAAYLANSRSAADDHKLWELAMADARVMADISRAMKDGAPNKVAFY